MCDGGVGSMRLSGVRLNFTRLEHARATPLRANAAPSGRSSVRRVVFDPRPAAPGLKLSRSLHTITSSLLYKLPDSHVEAQEDPVQGPVEGT